MKPDLKVVLCRSLSNMMVASRGVDQVNHHCLTNNVYHCVIDVKRVSENVSFRDHVIKFINSQSLGDA